GPSARHRGPVLRRRGSSPDGGGGIARDRDRVHSRVPPPGLSFAAAATSAALSSADLPPASVSVSLGERRHPPARSATARAMAASSSAARCEPIITRGPLFVSTRTPCPPPASKDQPRTSM